MKVLTATINADHPQRGMLHAFRGLFGEPAVRDFDYLALGRTGLNRSALNEAFLAAVEQHQPDWIWLQVQETEVILPETLRRVRERYPHCVLTHWTGDARQKVSGYLGAIGRATHLTLVSALGNIGMYLREGAPRVQYCQIGLDWEEDLFPAADVAPPFRVPDVVFCGSYYPNPFPQGTAERQAAIRALQAAKIDVGIVGRNWPKGFPVVGECHVKDQIHVWRRAKVCLNVNHFNHIERYYSDRQLIAMASGRPLVCHYVPDLEAEFERGRHCEWYDGNTADLVLLVQSLLDDPLRAARLGAAGRAKVIQEHTWFARILKVLPTIEELRRG